MIAVLLLAAVAVAAALVTSRERIGPEPLPVAPPARPGPGPIVGSGGWDLAGQHALASAPMAALPAVAAQPQPMTTDSAGDPITIPPASQWVGRWIPAGFPATPEGALGQLAALDEAAMRGGDPGTYALGYRDLALPGAPQPQNTGLFSLLRSLRTSAGLDPTGVVLELTTSFQVTHGQIKGSTDGGRYVVACVLGQFSVDYRGQTRTAGVGDCQALRHDGSDWRIAPGEVAAAAPCAWPGSADAVRAGYRDVKRGG
ncbi:hypothetical protein [Saccharopolyspora sp. NPDC049426]|uniref:hypothetical protein n=1 Tax=Saccharopolyspora sp. NPDC049426 TaxID=3155652 RepID=UPI003433DA1C